MSDPSGNATMAGQGYAEFVTHDNKAPLIKIMAAFLMCLIILCTFARTLTKIFLTTGLKTDDWLAVAATVVATGQYITNIIQAAQGFGKHINVLGDSDRNSIVKGEYASNILFIVALLLGKLSAASMTKAISHRKHWKYILGFQALCGAWAGTAFVSVLFQCGIPAPWDITSNKCFDRTAFWVFFSIFNIVSDLFLIVVMVINVRLIQTTQSKKIVVMCVFGCRVFIIPAIAAQLYFTIVNMRTSDFTFDYWQLTLAIQLVQCMSILSICIPVLKPLMDNAESGLRLADSRRVGQFDSAYAERSGSGTRSRTYIKGGSRADRSGNDVLNSKRSDVFEMSSPKSKPGTSSGHRKGWDNQSHTSQTILIQQTWYVDVESKSVDEARTPPEGPHAM